MTNRQRLFWIDVLKGVSIILVVVGHVLDGYIGANIWPTANRYMEIIYEFIYCVHMPLCFAISGYLYRIAYFRNEIANKWRIKNHVIDFTILYVVFCVLMWVFKLLMSGSVNNEITIKSILYIWAIPMPTYWYFYVLIGLYLIFSISMLTRCKTKIVLIISLVLSVLSTILPSISWFQISRILFYSLFFVFGMYYVKYDRLFSDLFNWVLMLGGFLCCLFFAIRGDQINRIPAVATLLPLMIICGLFGIFKNMKIKSGGGVMQICGKHMQEIYVTHCFIAPAIRMLLIKIKSTNLLFDLSITTALSLIIPILFGVYLKQYNLYDLVFRPYSKLKNK